MPVTTGVLGLTVRPSTLVPMFSLAWALPAATATMATVKPAARTKFEQRFSISVFPVGFGDPSRHLVDAQMRSVHIKVHPWRSHLTRRALAIRDSDESRA